jgi:hypothetical protein
MNLEIHFVDHSEIVDGALCHDVHDRWREHFRTSGLTSVKYYALPADAEAVKEALKETIAEGKVRILFLHPNESTTPKLIGDWCERNKSSAHFVALSRRNPGQFARKADNIHVCDFECRPPTQTQSAFAVDGEVFGLLMLLSNLSTAPIETIRSRLGQEGFWNALKLAAGNPETQEEIYAAWLLTFAPQALVREVLASKWGEDFLSKLSRHGSDIQDLMGDRSLKASDWPEKPRSILAGKLRGLRMPGFTDPVPS